MKTSANFNSDDGLEQLMSQFSLMKALVNDLEPEHRETLVVQMLEEKHFDLLYELLCEFRDPNLTLLADELTWLYITLLSVEPSLVSKIYSHSLVQVLLEHLDTQNERVIDNVR